jgi:hypothetical protein
VCVITVCDVEPAGGPQIAILFTAEARLVAAQWPVRETGDSAPSRAGVKMIGFIPPLPMYL